MKTASASRTVERWWNVAEEKLFEFLSMPGIRRDGTALESDFYSDGEWVRWRRGKPRKIGGYRAMSQLVKGPVQSLLVDSRNGINTAHFFSRYGIQRQQFSLSGAGGGIEDRTPLGYYTGAGDPLLTWSHGIMTDSLGGSNAVLLAASSPDLADITSDTPGQVFSGNMSDSKRLTPLSDSNGLLQVSGGVTVLQPFPVVYGSAGLIRIGNPNDISPTTWDVGGSSLATTANPAGTKIVYGAPVRGGSQSPAGLFWALDALIRVSFNPGNTQALWQFDTLSSPTTIMSKKCVVEHDGKFFWVGTDRFLMYNGVVQEMPNQMNSDWFFDNLNYEQRNKVWGTKVPRFGEIWWFYPRGSDTECNDAVIWNYVENTWYDAKKTRSAGAPPQLFRFPIWAGGEDKQTTTVLPVGLTLSMNALATAPTKNLFFANTDILFPGMLVESPGSTAVAPNSVVSVVLNAPDGVTLNNNITINMPVGTLVNFSAMLSPFVPGEIVVGGTSGARGQVVQADSLQINVKNVTGTFVNGEALTGNLHGTATIMSAPFSQELHTSYQHEYGLDKVIGSEVQAIPSSFTSKFFGFAVGNPFASQPVTDDFMTELHRMELDFKQAGALTFTALGRSFAQDPNKELQTISAEAADSFVEFRGAQERILAIKVESNVKEGFYEQGQVMLRLAQGDSRSSKDTSEG